MMAAAGVEKLTAKAIAEKTIAATFTVFANISNSLRSVVLLCATTAILPKRGGDRSHPYVITTGKHDRFTATVDERPSNTVIGESAINAHN